MNGLRTRLPRLARSSLTATRPANRAPLSTNYPRLAASGGDHAHDAHDAHDSHYDPPGGWLWGERPGEKSEKEGWETGAWVFVGAWVVAVAAYTMKEDTSIQTWALEEARRRLEKEGFYDEKN